MKQPQIIGTLFLMGSVLINLAWVIGFIAHLQSND